MDCERMFYDVGAKVLPWLKAWHDHLKVLIIDNEELMS